MNKKLFTLMTLGLLAAGSAFNGVNAQTAALTDGAELKGDTWYYIGDGSAAGTRMFLRGEKDNAVKETILKGGIKSVSALKALTDKDNYLWKIEPVEVGGVTYFRLTNKKTEGVLTFKSDGSIPAAAFGTNDSKIQEVTWFPTKKNVAAGKQIQAIDNGHCVTLTDAASVSVDMGATAGATTLIVYTQDASDALESDKLNQLLGNGFTFNFPAADPAPADNVFSGKLTAVEVPAADPGAMVGTANVAVFNDGAKNGLYFVTSAANGALVKANDGKTYFANQTLFEACKVIAIDPVANYEVNNFSKVKGEGYKFQTIAVGDLVTTAAAGKTHYDNAKFKVIAPDEVNKKGAYLISVAKPWIADKKTDAPVQSTVAENYVMAFTTMGASYVTTYSDDNLKNGTFDAKVSGSNVLEAADLLKTDGAAVFNIQFTSNYDKLSETNSSEYGKYLRVTSNGTTYSLLAEGSTYVNLDAPESQWIITDYADGIFTFTNREVNGQTLAVELRKTDTKNVYNANIAGGKAFNYAYVKENGSYDASQVADFGSGEIQVKLIPATMTVNGGFANFTEEEMANPVQVKFTMNTALFSEEMYLTKNGTNVGLTAEEDEAALWDIIKFAAKADSISSKIKYAYLKDKKVAKSDDVDNIGITTYALKLNGEDLYLNSIGALTATKKLSEAPRQIIKVLNGGSLYIFNANTTTSNEFDDNVARTSYALSVDNTAALSVTAVPIYNSHQTNSVMEFVPVEVLSESLEAEPRHASFKSVNGGFLGMDENNNAIIAATQDEAKTLTFWLDTTDVKDLDASFYISQAMPEGLKAAEPRMFLFNAADSTKYYDEGTASVTTDLNYLLSDRLTPKAIFKAATLISKDSINTIIKGKEVGLNKDNGLDMFKFQIKAVEDEEYVIVNGDNYLTSINGKIGLDNRLGKALVVTLGEGDATANEAIEAAGVQVIGGQGAVTVQGAAGKVITVANVLGQTIANQVAASDNVTIAAPAGIVVVAVEGEATKVVVK